MNEKIAAAVTKSLEWDKKIPVGIFYKNNTARPFVSRMGDNIPGYEENPPAEQQISSNGKPLETAQDILDSLEV